MLPILNFLYLHMTVLPRKARLKLSPMERLKGVPKCIDTVSRLLYIYNVYLHVFITISDQRSCTLRCQDETSVPDLVLHDNSFQRPDKISSATFSAKASVSDTESVLPSDFPSSE